MREVMDTYETDDGDRRPQSTAYVAQPLECGHDGSDGGQLPPRGKFRPDRLLVGQVVARQQRRTP